MGESHPPLPPLLQACVEGIFKSCEVTPRRQKDGIYFLESDVQRKDTARKHGCGPSQMGPPQTPSREEELVSTSNTPVESGKQRLYLLASTAPTTEQRLKH
ncbi:hypothetical protein V1264_016748 [Littorina saxatilis]|uniref:Uncharacterized protein n=1 Tax=Littorina saxatilis TaxID=31220 RepID=A0AAN9BL94_9CAEN